MATALTLPRGPTTVSATIDALEARELDFSGNVPKAVLIEFVGIPRDFIVVPGRLDS